MLGEGGGGALCLLTSPNLSSPNLTYPILSWGSIWVPFGFHLGSTWVPLGFHRTFDFFKQTLVNAGLVAVFLYKIIAFPITHIFDRVAVEYPYVSVLFAYLQASFGFG